MATSWNIRVFLAAQGPVQSASAQLRFALRVGIEEAAVALENIEDRRILRKRVRQILWLDEVQIVSRGVILGITVMRRAISSCQPGG